MEQNMATRPGSIQSPADFNYDNLSGSKSKRFLKVLPTRANNMVQLQLWEEPTAVSYRCLSYTAGAPTPTFAIQVNGCTMQVGRNLHELLTVAAKRFANKILWIDAVCINQGDNAEKAVQVQTMGNTFREATEVLVWLGEDAGIARLFDYTVLPQTWQHRAVTTCQSKGSRGPCEDQQSD